jgi:hypothetical protein
LIIQRKIPGHSNRSFSSKTIALLRLADEGDDIEAPTSRVVDPRKRWLVIPGDH